MTSAILEMGDRQTRLPLHVAIARAVAANANGYQPPQKAMPRADVWRGSPALLDRLGQLERTRR